MALQQINVGDRIPLFTINDHEGMEIETEDLIGSPFVLYFYPQDDTPGCTKEACAFRDNMEKFDASDTLVIGVSSDNSSSHNKFIDKHNLNFTLLCDEDLKLAHKFGAIKENDENGRKTSSLLRSTYVVDSDGIVRWIERPVTVDGHVERVLKAVEQVIREEANK